MTCRRCNTDRNLGHFHNDIFQGWFCPACVDELADAWVASAMADITAAKRTEAPT